MLASGPVFVQRGVSACAGAARGISAARQLFTGCGRTPATRRKVMRTIKRLGKGLAALALAWMVGTIPACGTMGGGGMGKYLIDPGAVTGEVVGT
jgi:hypothetical protein